MVFFLFAILPSFLSLLFFVLSNICVALSCLQVVAVEKLCSAFGYPQDQQSSAPSTNLGADGPDVDSSELAYADWYMTLQPLSSGRYIDEKVDSDEMLHFAIKANGEDLDSITAFASYCILNAVVLQPEKYALRAPPGVGRMVVCEIVHHAAMTEHLLSYLETVLEGVRFMCHYDVPCCVEEDDCELLYYARRLTQHPLSYNAGFSSSTHGRLGEQDGKSPDVSLERRLMSRWKESKQGDDDDDNNDHGDYVEQEGKYGDAGEYGAMNDGAMQIARFKTGCGALIGIDLEVVAKSLVVLPAGGATSVAGADVDVDLDATASAGCVVNPYDIAGAVRPFEERLRFFAGREEDYAEMEWLFGVVHRMQYNKGHYGAGVGGGDSDIDLEGEEEEDQEPERERDPVLDAEQEESRRRTNAKLDAEYRGAQLKVVDLGNACWTHKHFTEDIQTRQYRAPEVLVGASYDTSADMWSVACIVFELLTGDLMFDPHAGKSWSREEDHLALMMELIGSFPKSLLALGKFSDSYFNKKGELKHIHNLNYWGLSGVLSEKYRFSEADSAEISDFLLKILEV
jgi:hypothetical protein